jgi:alpha-tubulin suppressor-like RCC1 family protein
MSSHMRTLLLPLLAITLTVACQQDTGTPLAPASESKVSASAATADPTFRQVSASVRATTCAITTDDRAYCWGNNSRGQLGNGDFTGPETCFADDPCSTRPVAVKGGLRFRNVSPGGAHACGVTTDGKAYCWGSNAQGQIGDGTRTDRSTPVLVSGGLRWREVTAGLFHSCGITTSDRVFCWGLNGSGQIGDSTRELVRRSPVQVAGGRFYGQIDAGEDFTCAVTLHQRALCWGRNDYGNLGIGTATLSRWPRLVAGGHLFARVSAGPFSACGLTPERYAYCWGDNQFAELGIGSVGGTHYKPTRAIQGTRLKQVEAGGEHTCGRPSSGKVLCWGFSRFGQLGGPDNFPLPTEVTGAHFFARIAVGETHTCGVTAGTEEVLCWGQNQYGQLGDGTTTDRSVPTHTAHPI